MSISPHDFPDEAARDADPETIPLGPQSPSVQTSISADLSFLDGVSQTIVQHARPNGRGPLEIVLLHDESLSKTPGEIRDQYRTTISSYLPAGYTGQIRETPVGRNQAVPPESTIVGSVLVWRHPLLPHVEGVLSNHGLVYSFTPTWRQHNSELMLSPAVTDWAALKPLYVKVSGPTAELETVVDDVMQQVISELPRPSVTTVSVYTTNENDDHSDASDLPGEFLVENGELVFELAFADRELLHDPASGVYNAPAEDLSGVVDHALSERQTPGSGCVTDVSSTSSESDGVQLTITSPPYLDVVNYESFASGSGTDWGRETGTSVAGADEKSSDDEVVACWKSQQEQIFEQVFEATKNGGYCAVVIGHVKISDGKWIPLPHEFSDVMRSIGWEFHERVIWRKIGSRASRFGTTIQHPKPTYYYPNQIHEEIMIWRKGDIKRRKDPSEELEISELMKKEIANNVWHIPTVPHNKGVNHPCPFPEEIAHRLTRLYSYPGDIVVDPMVGSGTTLKVADRLDRVAIGTELQPAFVAESRRRLSIEEYTRADQIIPSFETHVDGDSQDARIATSDVELKPAFEKNAQQNHLRTIVTDGNGSEKPSKTTNDQDPQSELSTFT